VLMARHGIGLIAVAFGSVRQSALGFISGEPVARHLKSLDSYALAEILKAIRIVNRSSA